LGDRPKAKSQIADLALCASGRVVSPFMILSWAVLIASLSGNQG
jgi:hypothetical protein